jgi:very-short-patch-repair endonuclease
MKTKIIFPEEIKNQIFEKLDNGGKLRKVAREFGTNLNMIYKLLYDKYKNLEPKIPENKVKVFRCKVTNQEIIANDNRGGQITTFLKKHRPDAELFLHNKAMIYYIKNKKEWYEQYFDIIFIDKPLKKKCKLCDDYETDELINKTGAYSAHLTTKHKINILEYINKFPEETEYFNNSLLIKKTIKDEEFKDVKNYLICKVCGCKFKIVNAAHLKTHNLTVEQYKLKYTVTNIASDESINQMKRTCVLNKNNSSNGKRSNAEKDIETMLIENKINYLNNNKEIINNAELDFYIPDYKIAIEYNGLYWHTEKHGKSKNYHLNKLLECNKKGIKLIHIFEDEWVKNKILILNKLKHILNINKGIKIHARKCKISEITKQEKCLFLEQNHIQGNDLADMSLGAFYCGELISVMTFNTKLNLRSSKDRDYVELSRFCVKQNFIVTGIANRLLKYYLEKYKIVKIVSFADRRWTIDEKNNLYTKLNFTLDKILPPDYKYFNSKITRYGRIHKSYFSKKKIKKKYPYIYDDEKTEHMMTKEINTYRIWDCGLLRYILENKKGGY